MFITDLYGKQIEITDLSKAIEQAENFKDFEHTDRNLKILDKERKDYWTDLYNKLIKLQK